MTRIFSGYPVSALKSAVELAYSGRKAATAEIHENYPYEALGVVPLDGLEELSTNLGRRRTVRTRQSLYEA